MASSLPNMFLEKKIHVALTSTNILMVGAVAQKGSHTPANRLAKTCSLGLQCKVIDTSQNKVSADQDHIT